MTIAFHFVTAHVLSVVGFAMAALLAADVLRGDRAPGTTYAWLLAILFVPYLGVPLYLALGGRKLARMARSKNDLYAGTRAAGAGASHLERMLCGLGAPPARAGQELAILGTGEQAFAAVMATLESATQAIEISTLILADDEVGRAVLDCLERKARAGVVVRVLIDGLFAFHSPRRRLRALQKAGGQVARFMPVLHSPFRGRTNLRLHRKIVAVDGQEAIVGGMNIAREYMGPTPLAGRWRDISVRLRGAAAADLVAIFRSDWAFATRSAPLSAPAPVDVSGRSTVEVVGSGPDVPSDLLYDAFLTGVFRAERRLWIATPYFIPDEALTRALVLAARRGVDVRVLAPARSNHRLADLAGASTFRRVAAAGVKVLAYGPGMLHAKLMVIDDEVAIVGSANFDMRSLFLDYEVALFCSSAPDIAAAGGWFEEAARSTVSLPPATRTRAMVERLARLIGPLV
ncbi:MAG TPA: phospholipase D-like domain-containing protein [Polyangia bacterium]|nr:phospholipase D-like domain-containing protein [Polyangia bacterium]